MNLKKEVKELTDQNITKAIEYQENRLEIVKGLKSYKFYNEGDEGEIRMILSALYIEKMERGYQND